MKNNINIYHLIEGARQAKGLTVIIDVFRAFSLECYLYSMGVKEIRPVGTVEETFSFRDKLPGCILIGERQGKKCEGFDYGNSPSSIVPEDVAGKIIIHTTSAGTQGIVNVRDAEEIITGSLTNASAIAAYIERKNPDEVSLVCMGNGGIRKANEDELCARYIYSLLTKNPMKDMDERIANLKNNGGEHFFHKDKQEVFPEADFWMCVKRDIFPYVLRVEKDEMGFISKRIDVL